MLYGDLVTREQVRRAAFAGAFAGFVAPPVVGAVIGTVVFSLGGLLLGAVVGAVVSIPGAIVSGIAFRALLIASVNMDASVRTARQRFRVLGIGLAAFVCVLGVALLIADGAAKLSDAADVRVPLVIVMALVGGGLVGELVWQYTTSPAVDRSDAAE